MSFNTETYYPYVDFLADHIREKLPDAKLFIHQTWAYEEGSDRLLNIARYHAWPLEPGIITARVQRPAGRGDLVMEFTYGHRVSEDKGFLHVPDALRIARLIDDAEKKLNCP